VCFPWREIEISSAIFAIDLSQIPFHARFLKGKKCVDVPDFSRQQLNKHLSDLLCHGQSQYISNESAIVNFVF
jgi:hypothetical protein